ncbi:glutathionylspermidine synthase family protein [Saccharibacillus sp. CPCC 101409]|uniref:glutathionylspermidine synthase family protein n=1 Tax=Saccharibacillus sp. CPCC 101409 TaxID=3058041 RepID=UPI0026718B97|nr:glutathionylspermidine synthase family protein [Saccharibacillus sp. CPCC 101409]MDO3409954.1 glutathionylspermidine synthase family protein [Saccharibacillus sp. CPCC 101409]
MSGADVFEIVGSPSPGREALVEELRGLGFAWADYEEERYWIDQAAAMDAAVYEELEQASRRLWSVFDKAVRYVHRRRDLYELIGIPPVLWNMLDQMPVADEAKISRYARFDFAVSAVKAEGAAESEAEAAAEGAVQAENAEPGVSIKLLELNADTPTGYVEASIATPWICGRTGLRSVNGSMPERVRAAWAAEQPDTAACIAYGGHLEDSGTIEALVKHSGREMRLVDCLDLSIDDGLVKDGEGSPIGRMFALYPKEWMSVDDGGEALAYAVESGQLKLFNPPHAILLQSKGMMAVVWGLYELGMLYGEEEREAIARYMLPTYNKPVFSGDYVSKSMFGREGGSVRMYGRGGELELQDEEGYDTSDLFPVVYQKRADLPHVETCEGELHLLTGMFVIDGVPCGLLGRAGGLITGNASHFIALGVK